MHSKIGEIIEIDLDGAIDVYGAIDADGANTGMSIKITFVPVNGEITWLNTAIFWLNICSNWVI